MDNTPQAIWRSFDADCWRSAATIRIVKHDQTPLAFGAEGGAWTGSVRTFPEF
jgi:hypothetical protein